MVQESSSTNQPGVKFWFSWTLATAAAWAISLSVNIFFDPDNWLGSLWLDGLILGFLQWLVLRRYLSHAIGWLLATFVSIFLAGAHVFFGKSFIVIIPLWSTNLSR